MCAIEIIFDFLFEDLILILYNTIIKVDIDLDKISKTLHSRVLYIIIRVHQF
jgi:hypothetical protein